MSSSLKRIKDYIDLKGIKISAFEKSVGLSNGSFGGQLKKDKSIGVDKLENILMTYPDLNANWVLTGKESMLRNDTSQGETPISDSSIVYQLKQTLQNNHNELIALLNKLVVIQQETSAMLDRAPGEKGKQS